MPRTANRKKGTYYDRTCKERLEYQRAYYAANKEKLRRKRELEHYLNPESRTRYLEYCRRYYQLQKAKQIAPQSK
jgi:hypothetical protein